MIKIRTLERIDDPQRPGASIRSGVAIKVDERFGKKLIAEGKAEEVADSPDEDLTDDR